MEYYKKGIARWWNIKKIFQWNVLLYRKLFPLIDGIFGGFANFKSWDWVYDWKSIFKVVDLHNWTLKKKLNSVYNVLYSITFYTELLKLYMAQMHYML